MSTNKDWFSTWFNTKYYHILYQNRNFEDAEAFINNLTDHLNPAINSAILDLACGKGRHSIYLNKKGFNVLGSDLSEQSIIHAKKSENDSLTFLVNDMRNEIEGYKFDYIFNLFTSFGYFENQEDDLKVLRSVYNMLNKNGTLILDYLNVDKAIDNLIPFEIKVLDGIEFSIKKYLDNGFIKKEIRFRDNDDKFFFTEQVKALDLDDFKTLFEKSGLKIKNVFGDYNLNVFNVNSSERLIFEAIK